MPGQPTQDTLHGRVADLARHAPERIALVFQDERISYAELLRRADTLTARLLRLGVRPEQRVAIHLERSPYLIVSMLAVLRAGAAYVPVPPDYPAERVRFLLDDCGAAAVIAPAGAELPGGPVHVTPGGPEGAGDIPVRRPEVPADGAAYVLYTSGSTGRPKGVVVSHRNALGLVSDQDYADFSEDETFLQLAPVAFDASAFEIWGALTNGARLVLPAPSYQAIEELGDLLREQAVSTLFLTPALFHEVVRGRISILDGVRRVVVGGDLLSAERATSFLAHRALLSRPVVLVNGYGPTESTTFATAHRVAVADGADGAIPVGRPLGSVAVHLLDAELAPVPAGQRGEMWIGGRGVTRGYLGRPGLTARSFLPDPFAGVPGARMYRTGDLGRRRPDGVIEFVGRVDDQVKVNGFRIEPKEVEAALLALPGVRDAGTVAAASPDGGKQLISYVVAEPGHHADPSGLRSALAATLPGHLVPSRVVLVDALPRTPSGKLDRGRLRERPVPAPVPAPGAGDAVPRGRNQTVLAEIWADVLGVPKVGPDDDFFALGGDSMLAIRAIADAEERGVRVSLVDMFENPILRHICPPDEEAAEVAAAGTAVPDVPAANRVAAAAAGVPGTPDGSPVPARETSCPAARLQLGLIFEASATEGALYHDVMAHRIEAPLDAAALRTALHVVATTHEVLRTRFDLGAATGPRQVVEPEPRLLLALDDLRGLDAEQEEKELARIAASAGRRFDVAEAPLMRVYAAARDDASFWLVYGFHHAVMDGWSDTVFLSDLVAAYAEARDGRTPVPRQPAVPYAEFVRLEQRMLESREARAFWSERCSSLQPTPLRPGAASRGADRRRVSRPLPGSLRTALEKASADLRLPLKSLVLAAHLSVVGAQTVSDRPVSGLQLNGRPEVVGADRLVGLFLNIVPVSADLTDVTWDVLARRAFDEERAVLPFRRFPYPAIRELAGRPLFDVVLNFAHFRLWAGLDSHREGPRVGATRMWDKSSYPLVVDVALDAVGDGMRVELTGDCALWGAEDLHRTAIAYQEALAALAADPRGSVF